MKKEDGKERREGGHSACCLSLYVISSLVSNLLSIFFSYLPEEAGGKREAVSGPAEEH